MLSTLAAFVRALRGRPRPPRASAGEVRAAVARDREQGFTEEHGWYGPTYPPVHQPVHRPQRPSLP